MKFHKMQQSKFGLPVTATGCTRQVYTSIVWYTHITNSSFHVYKEYLNHNKEKCISSHIGGYGQWTLIPSHIKWWMKVNKVNLLC